MNAKRREWVGGEGVRNRRERRSPGKPAGRIVSLSHHAIARYQERCGLVFGSEGEMLERLWELVGKAVFDHIEPPSKPGHRATEVWLAKGWRLLVTDGRVETMFVRRKVRFRKGTRFEEVEGD